MGFIAIDLGTTNIKVAAFDDQLTNLGIESENVIYEKNDNFVEFNADTYFETVLASIQRCCQKYFKTSPYPIRQIILTGQAESLVVIDRKGKPIRNAISWLDMRSKDECDELKSKFDADTCYHITGQPEIIPTWPITKILWLKKHEPQVYGRVAKYLLLKDFIQLRLCGSIAGEFSIYNFSHYFNISKKEFWLEILDYCGIKQEQLPGLIEPCTVLGTVTDEVAGCLKLTKQTKVNVGTLDHFAGMIGTGNITEGTISESTGTVLSIATMLDKPTFSSLRIPCHYGPFKNIYVLLPVCESGGISLEWFKSTFLSDYSYDQINTEIGKKVLPNELIFLPYLTGINAPDFNKDAKGVFYGIQVNHDKFDFAYAVMEGVAHLLKMNIDTFEKAGIKTGMIISTGGGAKSSIWSQIKANITNHIVAIPENAEAACLGAAVIGAVSENIFVSYQEAIQKSVRIKKQFDPNHQDLFQKKHNQFKFLYQQLQPMFPYKGE